MNEILILYIINKSENTMYGISKKINSVFGSITKPGFGTLQPALKRLEKQGFILINKFFTDGGKPCFYYSITQNGVEYLKEKLLSKNTTNPMQFIPLAKIKIICSDILNNDEKKNLYTSIKKNLIILKEASKKQLNSDFANEYSIYRLTIDNNICEYTNFINLVEGLTNACNR